MKIYENILEVIGDTPHIRLNKLSKELHLKSEIIVKLESANPLGSVKDRTAFALIRDAYNKKMISKNTVIVEATSGNTGVGLAFICAYYDISLVIVMPNNLSSERKNLIKAFGHEVIFSPGNKGMSGAIEIQKELLSKNKNYISLYQFDNSANPEYHYQNTAAEILAEVGKIDIFVAGVGTGGTISGVGRKLKEINSNTLVIAVEPASSAVISGNKASTHKIQGLGAGFIPNNLDKKIIDKVITITDEDSYYYTRLLAKKEGILAGISSGAALAAAVQIAREEIGKRILVILPDTGTRYLTTDLFGEENV